jgi:hypothetical protein
MKVNRKPARIACFVAIFLMATLAWLTVSLPFVYAAQKEYAESKATGTDKSSDNDANDNNPFSNTTEEKTPSNINLSEEYLHDTDISEQYTIVPSTEYKVEHVATYIAFHGELISPPPDVC